jgi:hypothetical protein
MKPASVSLSDARTLLVMAINKTSVRTLFVVLLILLACFVDRPTNATLEKRLLVN